MFDAHFASEFRLLWSIFNKFMAYVFRKWHAFTFLPFVVMINLLATLYISPFDQNPYDLLGSSIYLIRYSHSSHSTHNPPATFKTILSFILTNLWFAACLRIVFDKRLWNENQACNIVFDLNKLEYTDEVACYPLHFSPQTVDIPFC